MSASDMTGFKGPAIVYPGPDSLSGLYAWWKASDFDALADGTEITTWNDSFGKQQLITAQSGAGSRPFVVRNALNGNMTAIRRIGAFTTNRGMFTASLSGISTLGNTWTLFGIVQFEQVNTENDIFGIGGTSGNAMRFGTDATNNWLLVYGNVGGWTATPVVVFGRWYAVILANDNNTETLYVNGAPLTWSSQPGTRAGSTDLLEVFEGYSGASGYMHQGKIAEMSFHSTALDARERDLLWTYARSRYGLQFQ